MADSEPLTGKAATDALRQAVPALDRHQADRRMELLSARTWYFTGDSLDLEKVMVGWDEKLADALARGFDGMRVAASVPWMDD